MADESKFCISCGAKVESNEPLQESASQVAAASAGATAAVEESAQTVSQPVSQPVQQAAPAPQPQSAPPVQAPQPKPEQPAYSQPAYVQPQPQPTARPVQQGIQEMPVKPEKVTPLPVWKYVGIFLIMGIPLIGIVMLFVWAFGSSFNKNTKNFARAVLIMFLISLVLTIVGYFTIWANIQDIMNNMVPNMQFPSN